MPQLGRYQSYIKESKNIANSSVKKIKKIFCLFVKMEASIFYVVMLVVVCSVCNGSAQTWSKADLTNYESYPAPGSEECIKYNGCKYTGHFAFVSGKKPESWVKANNIIAIHSKDSKKYKLKTFRIKQGNKQIDAKVYDECSDKDCDRCCTKNLKKTKFLIDIEKYTMQRFGAGSGVVEWTCLDC